jgi:hypothetical protein
MVRVGVVETLSMAKRTDELVWTCKQREKWREKETRGGVATELGASNVPVLRCAFVRISEGARCESFGSRSSIERSKQACVRW